MKSYSLIILLYFLFSGFSDQDSTFQNIPKFELNEITIIEEYHFKNKKEEIKYYKLENDIRKVYPLILIIRSEYERINSEMNLYEGEKRKNYLKWSEDYLKDKYFGLLSGLSVRQGRLLLKLIDREFDKTPYELIKSYRNGFRAALWQGAANLFLASLKTNYEEKDNPMIEHLILKIDNENKTTYPDTKTELRK